MSILRRKPQPVETVSPENRDFYMEKAGMLSDMWVRAGMEPIVHRMVRLEDLKDSADSAQVPTPVHNATALSGNFLPSVPGDNDPIRRATGKEMVITIPRGEVAGELVSASKHALLDLRAANGHFYGTVHDKLMADAREANLFRGSRRKLAEFTYDEERQDWVLVGVVTDNHPVIMIDHFVRPHPLKPTEFQYAHSIPRFPVLEDEKIFQQTGMIIKRGPDLTEIERVKSPRLLMLEHRGERWVPFTEEDVIPGLSLMHKIACAQKDSEIRTWEDYVAAGGSASAEEIAGYSRLPKGSSKTNLFNASFPYRAAALYGSILAQAGINEQFLSVNPKELKSDLQREIATKIYEAALAQYARSRIKRNTVDGKGLYASIGLLDTTDPTMDYLKDQFIQSIRSNPESRFDPDDPSHMDQLQGAIVIEHNGSRGSGMLSWKKPGEKESSPLEGITPMLKFPRRDNEGFWHITEAIDELSSGDFKGLPKMPGLVALFMSPQNVDEGMPTKKVNLLVDINELPGYGAEWFYTSPDTQPFAFFNEDLTPNKTTLTDIMRGRYARQQIGAAALLRNVTHIMVNTNGITTDDFGNPSGYNVDALLGPKKPFDKDAPLPHACFDLSVPVVAAQVVGNSVALVPAGDTEPVRVDTTDALIMSSEDVTQIASSREIKKAISKGRELPVGFTATNTLGVDGHIQVVAGIIDNKGNVHASAITEDDAKNAADKINNSNKVLSEVNIPVPEVRVMAYN